MESAQAFFAEKISELQLVQQSVMKGIQTSSTQPVTDLPQTVMVTAISTVILAQLVLMLASKSGRSIIFKTVDTILAIIFLVIIMAIVLGLPFGKVFITVKFYQNV